jgi:hypothetical protein
MKIEKGTFFPDNCVMEKKTAKVKVIPPPNYGRLSRSFQAEIAENGDSGNITLFKGDIKI